MDDVVNTFQFMFSLLKGAAGDDFVEGLLENMWRNASGDIVEGDREDGGGKDIKGFLEREGASSPAPGQFIRKVESNVDADADIGGDGKDGDGIQWLVDDKGLLADVVNDWSKGAAERTFNSTGASRLASRLVTEISDVSRSRKVDDNGVIDGSQCGAISERGECHRRILEDLSNEK